MHSDIVPEYDEVGSNIRAVATPMITSNTRHHFGAKAATVETPSFSCLISTAKEGLFKKQSIIFFDFSAGMASRRPVAKLLFSDILDSNQRLGFHDVIVGVIDQAGMGGKALRDTLEELFQGLQREGIAIGAMTEDP